MFSVDTATSEQFTKEVTLVTTSDIRTVHGGVESVTTSEQFTKELAPVTTSDIRTVHGGAGQV